jgi:hypothetical protein
MTSLSMSCRQAGTISPAASRSAFAEALGLVPRER